MLDFKAIKEIRLTDVLGRYGVALKYRGEWANGVCPLPTHKPGDKGRNFSVNVAGNYWRCFSESCNEKNGGKKGGDVINFVALMENCREREAAEKLATWYSVGQTKTAEHIAQRPSDVPKGQSKEHQDLNVPSGSVKTGYMQTVGAWFDVFIVRRDGESDADYLKRLKKGVMAQIFQSYKNGQSGREALAS